MPSKILALSHTNPGRALQGFDYGGKEAQNDNTLAFNALKDPCPSHIKKQCVSHDTLGRSLTLFIGEPRGSPRLWDSTNECNGFMRFKITAVIALPRELSLG